MKRIWMITLALLLTGAASMAQKDALNSLFNKYERDRSFTVVSISGRMFSMFTNLEIDDPEDQAVIDMVSKLSGLKIITKESDVDGFKLYDEAISAVQGTGLEELMSIREKDQDIKFYAVEKDGKISDLLMILGGTDEFMLMRLTGIIELSELSKLSKNMDIQGLEHLEKIEDNN